MKRGILAVLVFGFAVAPVLLLAPETAFAQVLPAVRVQRLWETESANLDDRGRPLSSCAGQYRFDPPAKARMRGSCETGDPALLGVALMLRHINGDTGAVTNIATFMLDPVLGTAVLDFRTPTADVPLATTPTDVIQVIGPDGSVVEMGGWAAP